MLAESLKGARPRWPGRIIRATGGARLDRSCIFILPSRIGLAFGVSLLLMLLAAINYRNNLAYVLTFLLGSVFMVGVLHTYRNLVGLRLQVGGPPALFAGGQARFPVRLDSDGCARQALALGWSGGALQLHDLPADGAICVELSLPAPHRGWLPAPRLRVESRFPLGLMVAWSWIDPEQRALVYPQPLAGDLPLSAGAPEALGGEGRQVRGEGVDDYQGLRAYRPGDSKRRLDWKAYSRGRGLLVKEFSALESGELCLDFAALTGDVETRLSLLCHWVLELSAQQRPFVLQLPGQRLGPAGGETHREACLRALALYGGAP
ncbi:DUF58 domain-containing protein [Azotobacter salinestris]|uniref:DUF58 domain-containing protein n=1 Tax=Azotobacter salinestris TaxID=69964 RepID=UPI003D7F1B16